MLTGGIYGYPEAVIVAESVTLRPINETQVLLDGVPCLYERNGGALLAQLPFDATSVDACVVPFIDDGVAIIEDAMRSWKAFRHMERVP